MKRIAILCALGTVLFFSACTATRKNMNKTHQLTGNWSCVSAIVDGKALPAETVSALRLTLTQDRYKTEKGGQVLFDSSYRIDPSKTPKQINMVGTEGDLAGKEAEGI